MRGSPASRGYDSTWRRLSVQFRAANPICMRCSEAPATLADHIVPIRVDPGRRLDVTNLQSLCDSCHKVKTDEDARTDWSGYVPGDDEGPNVW